jgi:hypothetical protein
MLVKVLPAHSNGDFTSMGKLTDTKLRAMKPNGKIQKESDGDWLYAYIGAKSKSISWQMGYRFENKQKVLTLGRYPEVSLADARKKCLEARQVLADGYDPGLVKKSKKEAVLLAEKEKTLTFEAVAGQWFEKRDRPLFLYQVKSSWQRRSFTPKRSPSSITGMPSPSGKEKIPSQPYGKDQHTVQAVFQQHRPQRAGVPAAAAIAAPQYAPGNQGGQHGKIACVYNMHPGEQDGACKNCQFFLMRFRKEFLKYIHTVNEFLR